MWRLAGFIFSEDERTALIQTSGGPCAVIAPVQAFLIKNLIASYQFTQLREVSTPRGLFCFSLSFIRPDIQLSVTHNSHSLPTSIFMGVHSLGMHQVLYF